MTIRNHVRLDAELDRGIREFAQANGLTRSQATRELLRQALGKASPVDRGWREGFLDGHRSYQASLAERTEKSKSWLTGKRQ